MTTRRLPVLLAVALLAGACSGSNTSTPAAPGGGGTGGGGGGGSGGGGAAVSGIAVPTEISAIPTSSGGGAGAQKARASAAVAAATDYDAAPVRRYVNERALAQFDILNTIFQAMGQTHYADAENIGAGPYKSMVSWVEEQGKQVIPWVVDSTMEREGTADVNVVKVWMRQSMGDGQLHLIRVTVRIYQAPTRNADGSYADYGVWKLHAKFADDPAQGFFVAEASRGTAGETVILLSQHDWSGEVTRGVLHKSATSGYGKVSFPDWEACNGGGCTGTPPLATVTYVYDASRVSLRKEPASGPVQEAVKDRTAPVMVANRYGLFEAVSGDEAARHFGKTFGFPFRYAAAGGGEGWGSYGAWQGRHQIWVNGAALPAGTPVTRADVPSGQTAPVFTTSRRYVGTLTRRTLEPGTLEALQGAVVNTWENRQLTMGFDGAAWSVCLDAQWSNAGPPTCGSTLTLAEAELGQVLPGPGDTTRSAWLNACGNSGCYQVGFKPSGSKGAGLYLATPGTNGPPAVTDTPFNATAGANVGGGLNGQLWIVWDGTGWLRKEVVSFDPANGSVELGSNDQAFTFPQGADYYLNRNGASYVVRLDGAAYTVKFERQTAANPANVAALVPAGAVFRRAWGDTSADMTFDADPASGTFLGLLQGGVLVAQGEHALRAWVGGVQQADQYSWDYPGDPSQSWAAQQFLIDGSGALRLLDDPIQLRPVSLADGSGVSVSYALAFDGNWVNGLPNVWSDLQATGYQMTPEIAAKVVLIPDGQLVADGADNAYLFKALEVQEYLPVVPGATLADLGNAAALSLDALPAFVDGGLGAEPAVPLKYSEGVAVP